jgi:hypothetical protein
MIIHFIITDGQFDTSSNSVKYTYQYTNPNNNQIEIFIGSELELYDHLDKEFNL